MSYIQDKITVDLTVDATGGVQDVLDDLESIIAADVVLDLGGTFEQAVEYDESLVLDKLVQSNGTLTLRGGVAQTPPIVVTASAANSIDITDANLTAALGIAPQLGYLKDAWVTVVYDTTQAVGQVVKLNHAGITQPGNWRLTLAAGNWTVNPSAGVAYVVINSTVINCSTGNAMLAYGPGRYKLEDLMLKSTAYGLQLANGCRVDADDCNFSGNTWIGTIAERNSSYRGNPGTGHPCHYCGNQRGLYARDNSYVLNYGNGAAFATASHIATSTQAGIEITRGSYGEIVGTHVENSGTWGILTAHGAYTLVSGNTKLYVCGGAPTASWTSTESWAGSSQSAIGGNHAPPAANTYTATAGQCNIVNGSTVIVS